jgi:2-keto-4-pentenoate hydratase/2-oxohepta-3-ene-1,7-dioic acid hydratase in catechol pathway
MKLLTFSVNGRNYLGAAESQGVVDLAAAYAASQGGGIGAYKLAHTLLGDLLAYLQGGDKSRAAAQEAVDYAAQHPWGADGEKLVWADSDIQIKAPLLNPTKIICIGLNYRDHAEETGAKIPEEPVVFAKFSTAVIGPGENICLPKMSSKVDYETELAVIIGKRGKHIPAEEALDYVAGYTCFNDVSARDLQFRDGQWIKGKTPDTFAPMGPHMVTADEIPDPGVLQIKLILNDQVMQESNTNQLIFPVPQLIAYLSQLVTLEPGDVIATGTPSGVGTARDPQVFLKPGDVVTVEIEGIGRLTNTVVAE